VLGRKTEGNRGGAKLTRILSTFATKDSGVCREYRLYDAKVYRRSRALLPDLEFETLGSPWEQTSKSESLLQNKDQNSDQ